MFHDDYGCVLQLFALRRFVRFRLPEDQISHASFQSQGSLSGLSERGRGGHERIFGDSQRRPGEYQWGQILEILPPDPKVTEESKTQLRR